MGALEPVDDMCNTKSRRICRYCYHCSIDGNMHGVLEDMKHWSHWDDICYDEAGNADMMGQRISRKQAT